MTAPEIEREADREVGQEFWTPEFDITKRDDGTIIMAQKEPLEPFFPALADYLDKWAEKTPDATWLASRDENGEWERVSYSQAKQKARSIGAYLLGLGLGPEKPLIILSQNSLEHGLMGLACLYVGIPYAPVSPAYSLLSKDHAKLKAISTLLGAGAVFADDGAAFQTAFDAAFNADECAYINYRNVAKGAVSYSDMLTADGTESDAARQNVGAETVAKYLFTSGSTGTPKAVINTNGMICAMQAMVRDCYRFLISKPPVVLDWAPWNHTAAGNKVFYLTMTNGGAYYIDHGRPAPGKFDETLRNLREISCSWYFNVPVGWDLLVEQLEQDKELAESFFSNLGMMFYAGAGMAQHTWDRLRAIAKATTGDEVLLATSLGATETAPFALACTEVQEKSGNVGVPSRGLSMKLVPNGGKLELRLKGPSITPGYYGDPEKTKESFDEDGYYLMGDALRPADQNDFTKGFFFDGRLAENFKLNTGTWVAVGAVRAALVDAMVGLIKDAVVVGENKSQLGALVILESSAEALPADELRQNLEQKLADFAANSTGSASRVKRIAILETPPSFDKGEITEKGSLNQRTMRANNAELIEALYAGEGKFILA